MPSLLIYASSNNNWNYSITAKFVVSHCAFCKLRRDFRFFCSVNHFSEGGVSANHNVTCSRSLAENDSRPLKNSEEHRDGEWIFSLRREADVALFFILASDKNEKDHLLVDCCPKQDDHKATNLETRNKQNGSRSNNHESQTITF